MSSSDCSLGISSINLGRLDPPPNELIESVLSRSAN